MNRLAALTLVALTSFACALPANGGDSPRSLPSPLDPSATDGPPPAPPGRAWLVAMTSADEVALVDAATFAIVARAPLAGPDGARDLDVDPAASVVFAFVGDDDGPSGEVVRLTLGDGTLGAASHVTWFDGDARLARGADATLLFARGYAEQWKLVRDDGVATSSALAPPPTSFTKRGDAFDALGSTTDGALLRYHADVAAAAWPPPPGSALSPAMARAEATAQLVAPPTDSGGGACGCGAARAWIVDLADGDLVLRSIDAAGLGAPLPLGVDATGAAIEGAVALSCDGAIAVLLSGADALVTLRVASDGNPSDVATLPLPASVPARSVWFSRALAQIDERTVAVATDGGVCAVDVSGPAPTLDPARAGAELRAPLVSFTRALTGP